MGRSGVDVTIIEDDEFVGLDANAVRVGATVRMGQQLSQIAQDQAFLHKYTTGIAVPNAPGVTVASDHVHDGTDGLVIPVPLAHWHIVANLKRRRADDGTTYSGDTYRPFVWCPVYVPAGVSTVRVIMMVGPGDVDMIDQTVGVKTQDTSFGYVGSSGTWLDKQNGSKLRPGAIGSSYRSITTTVAVTPGAVNVFKFSAWDGDRWGNPVALPITSRRIRDIIIRPVTEWANRDNLLRFEPKSGSADTAVRVPGATDHLGAHAYTSTDSAMYNDDRAISSYLLGRANSNNALLYELAVGHAAGGNAESHSNDTSYQGHNHAGHASDYDQSGAYVETPLGSWFFGVGQEPVDASTSGFARVDQPNTTDPNFWEGRLVANNHTANTGVEVLHKLYFRLPQMQATDFSSGPTTKINAAFLTYNNSGSNLDIDLLIRDSDGTGGTTSSASVASSGGRAVTTINNIVTSAGSNEIKQAQISTQVSGGASGAAPAFIYGMCLWAST